MSFADSPATRLRVEKAKAALAVAKARRAALLSAPIRPKCETAQYQLKRKIIDKWAAGKKEYIMRTTDRAEPMPQLGEVKREPPREPEPVKVSESVLRGPDGKLYTNIPLGPVA